MNDDDLKFTDDDMDAFPVQKEEEQDEERATLSVFAKEKQKDKEPVIQEPLPDEKVRKWEENFLKEQEKTGDFSFQKPDWGQEPESQSREETAPATEQGGESAVKSESPSDFEEQKDFLSSKEEEENSQSFAEENEKSRSATFSVFADNAEEEREQRQPENHQEKTFGANFSFNDDFEVKEEAVTFGAKPSFMEEEGEKPLASSFVIEEQLNFSTVIKVICLLLILSVAGGFLIWKYALSEKTVTSPLIIKAEDGPMKVRPENAGGMDIPGQNKQVYRLIRSQDEERAVERFFPQTEEPVLPDFEENIEENDEMPSAGVDETDDIGRLILQSAAQVGEEPEPVQVIVSDEEPLELFPLREGETYENENENEPASVLAQEAVEVFREENSAETTILEQKTTESEDKNVLQTETKKDVSGAVSGNVEEKTSEQKKNSKESDKKASADTISKEKDTQKEKNKTVGKTTPKTPIEKKSVAVAGVKKTEQKSVLWAVQLLSLKDKKAAEKAWPKILKKNTALLIDLSHKIVEVDVPNKGKFYRLLVGKFKDRDEARSLCDKLKKRKQECVTAPF